MTLLEFLSNTNIQLPLKRESDDFHSFVLGVLGNYLNLLGQLTEPDAIKLTVDGSRGKIEKFCETAPEIIDAIYSGHPHDAYELFDQAVQPFHSELKTLVIDNFEEKVAPLYRVRRGSEELVTREDMFHVPFEKRHQVATHRYSIPGVPCLYLGGSLYTCWAEMGRPPFHELHASVFWLADGAKVSVLNLSNSPKRLKMYWDARDETNLQPTNELVSTHLLLWPLMALCSIKVKHRNSPFKPEYMFPQLLLQWIMKNQEFDGICYFSMHVKDITTESTMPPCNLVFPARSLKPAGRCDILRKKLRLTEPQNWQFLSATCLASFMGIVPDFEIEFVDGLKESYQKSEFGRLELRLRFLAGESIKAGSGCTGEVLP